MEANLREMRENQWVSENRIDKSRFVEHILPHISISRNDDVGAYQPPGKARRKRERLIAAPVKEMKSALL